MSLREYDALVDRVDAFFRATRERRGADLACRPGCSGCCQVQLTVSPVEAAAIRRYLAGAPGEVRGRVAERAHAVRPDSPGGTPCVMLDADGRCAVYPARPLVCRTQGLPLRYPAGTVPADAVRGRAGDGDVTWCPLTFPERPPEGADVLDAERVDVTLAVINRRFAERADRALEREHLTAIAAGAAPRDPPPGSPEAPDGWEGDDPPWP